MDASSAVIGIIAGSTGAAILGPIATKLTTRRRGRLDEATVLQTMAYDAATEQKARADALKAELDEMRVDLDGARDQLVIVRTGMTQVSVEANQLVAKLRRVTAERDDAWQTLDANGIERPPRRPADEPPRTAPRR